MGASQAQERTKVPLLGPTLRASMDKAVLVKMPEGIRTVVIGNPSVAHVNFDKSGLAVVTGRSFGETNLIILNEHGEIITQTDLIVGDDRKSLVSVQSGTSGKVTVSCDPRCQPIAVIGDDDRAFSGVNGQISTLTSAAQQAAQSSAGSAPSAVTQVAAPTPTAAPSAPRAPAVNSGSSSSRPGRSDGMEVIPARPAPKMEGVSAEAQ
ncbi:pilus assembly protein N-terminal domain-containing protein [Microvirga sp. VF16]|uniref:pilus assembly protein N-terminal domain-containing protein n=1 Tax=Microvirga sp. VF16 TaxID=2807101 RepID=UPI00193CCF1A|nr:pilus assembly protein N-terminal domain-containing protein [Microvirga sp. VF16]QRM35033.1 pilus assembly protein N-terminal domain-containing protein [Microvirga sp. VF16]